MANDFAKNKAQVGKALGYFVINGLFAIFFGIAYFYPRNQCYTIKTSSTPVDITVHPDANDVTAWFDTTCALGFGGYSAAAISSLGYLAKDNALRIMTVILEKLSRLLAYCVFIAVHIMRLSHTGAVCSGDYLPAEHRDDSIVSNYMIATGNFFTTYLILGWTVLPALLILLVCVKGDKWAAIALDAPK